METRARLVRHAAICVLVAVVLSALLVVAVALMRTPPPTQATPVITSCIDPRGSACDSPASVIEYIEQEASITLPAGAELLHTRSNMNLLQTVAFGYAVFSLAVSESDDVVRGLESRSPEEFAKNSRVISGLGGESLEGTFTGNDVIVSQMRTADPDRRLLVVSKQYYY